MNNMMYIILCIGKIIILFTISYIYARISKVPYYIQVEITGDDNSGGRTYKHEKVYRYHNCDESINIAASVVIPSAINLFIEALYVCNGYYYDSISVFVASILLALIFPKLICLSYEYNFNDDIVNYTTNIMVILITTMDYLIKIISEYIHEYSYILDHMIELIHKN